jgi:hypothetical protein
MTADEAQRLPLEHSGSRVCPDGDRGRISATAFAQLRIVSHVVSQCGYPSVGDFGVRLLVTRRDPFEGIEQAAPCFVQQVERERFRV